MRRRDRFDMRAYERRDGEGWGVNQAGKVAEAIAMVFIVAIIAQACTGALW